jgi:uncharacterized protein with HEPN domain
MKRTIAEFLQDILTAAEHALAFTDEVSFDQFLTDVEKQYAVLRALEIIGEAARYIPEETRQQYDDLPWRAMIGMRNIIIHHYFGVDELSVWRTVTEELPPLCTRIQQILDEQQTII